MAARRAKRKTAAAGPGRGAGAARQNLHLIEGEDTYLRDLHRETIIAAHLNAEDRELGLVRADMAETSLTETLGRVATPALFVQKQVVVISRLEKVREDDIKGLESYLATPAEHAVLIFEAAKLDRRTKLSKLLLARCEHLDAARLEDDGEAIEAAGRFAAEQGLTITPEATEDLVFAVGNDLGLLRREVEKLAAYAGKSGTAGQEDVAAVVVQARQFVVFEMAGYLAEGQRAPALLRLERLLSQGENPIGVVGALAYVFRQLMRARSLPEGATGWEAARKLRMQAPRAEAMVRQSRRYSRTGLRRALGLLLEADVALKSSAPDPEAILAVLVVNLARAEDTAVTPV